MLKYMRMGNKRIKAVWWILIVITVVTFVFLFGTAFDNRYAHKASGAVAEVEGTPITRAAYQSFLEEQRALYRRQYGSEPGEEDQRMLEAQAWRGIVSQTILTHEARALGLKSYDAEVVTQLRVSPPQQLASAPDFQTNGKFDPAKYQAALANPGNNWAPFEQQVADGLPSRKLQERLAMSLKLSQPELVELNRDLTESATATVVMVPPVSDGPAPVVTDADIERIYNQYKGRFAAPARVQVEVLSIPRQYSPEDLRAAREQAAGLAARARAGEDFAALARDFSQGSGAQQGGAINRAFQPSEFGPELAPRFAAMNPGDVADPIEQSGRFVVFKVLNKVKDPSAPTPSLQMAQIVIKARMSDDALRAQIDKLDKVRERATHVGLGKAATEAGLPTTKTPFTEIGQTPPQLYDAPEAVDWSGAAKVGAVSPVYVGSDGITVAEVSGRQPAGPAPKEDVKDELRQLGELEKRVQAAKPQADRIAAALAQGQTLEQAAAVAGLKPFAVTGMTRMQPDPRLAASAEAVGTIFGAPQGKAVGPILAPNAWYFVRRDGLAPADTAKFDAQRRGQLTTQLMQNRQQQFFVGWMADLRAKAKVQDLRTAR